MWIHNILLKIWEIKKKNKQLLIAVRLLAWMHLHIDCVTKTKMKSRHQKVVSFKEFRYIYILTHSCGIYLRMPGSFMTHADNYEHKQSFWCVMALGRSIIEIFSWRCFLMIYHSLLKIWFLLTLKCICS